MHPLSQPNPKSFQPAHLFRHRSVELHDESGTGGGGTAAGDSSPQKAASDWPNSTVGAASSEGGSVGTCWKPDLPSGPSRVPGAPAAPPELPSLGDSGHAATRAGALSGRHEERSGQRTDWSTSASSKGIIILQAFCCAATCALFHRSERCPNLQRPWAQPHSPRSSIPGMTRQWWRRKPVPKPHL